MSSTVEHAGALLMNRMFPARPAVMITSGAFVTSERQRAALARCIRIMSRGMADYQPNAVSTLGTKAKGHWQRISGTIQEIELFKSGAKLWLAPSTYIWVYRSNIKYFPALEHYQGKDIEVRTWVKKRQNVWSLLVRHPSQLIVKP